MYKNILIALDNSPDANIGIDLGIRLASLTGASLAGCHVYAALLHDERFRQMEPGLPERYQHPAELKRQRDNHESLISRGLRIIASSYTAVIEEKAREAGVKALSRHREGKNFEELVNEARDGSIDGPYDLFVIGAHGLGRVKRSVIGGVTERAVRRLTQDVLITREAPVGKPKIPDTVIAAIDGSPASFGALRRAVEISLLLSLKLEILSVYDPDFHYKAFRSLAGILSKEAMKDFNFKAQERLHEEIIDTGLEKIYADHLETALKYAKEAGVDAKTVLLSGKPFDEIIEYTIKLKPYLLVMGRRGIHSTEALDIGSNTENCLRGVRCNLLITSGELDLPDKGASYTTEETKMNWTEDAEEMLKKIPIFARGMAKKKIEAQAEADGVDEIDAEYMAKVRQSMGG